MKNQFGWAIREHDGSSVHVSEVPRGLDCGCICPKCGQPLIAKRGDEREHHFAHHELGDCNYQGETELHTRAKQILAEKKEITTKDGVFHFRDAMIEQRVGRYKVDVYLVSEEFNLAVEIFVSHKIDTHKHRFFVDSRTHSIEIDLTEVPRNISPEELCELVINRPDLQRVIYFPSRAATSGAGTNKANPGISGPDRLTEVGRFRVGEREFVHYKARNGVMIERENVRNSM